MARPFDLDSDEFNTILHEFFNSGPFFESPMADFGYDISNFTAVDPQYINYS